MVKLAEIINIRDVLILIHFDLEFASELDKVYDLLHQAPGGFADPKASNFAGCLHKPAGQARRQCSEVRLAKPKQSTA